MLLIALLATCGTIDAAINRRTLETLPAVVFFGILAIMFKVLSKSPRESKNIFGKRFLPRKWLFVLICLLGAMPIASYVDALVPNLERVVFSFFEKEVSFTIEIPSEKPIAASEIYEASGFQYYVDGENHAVICGCVDPSWHMRIPADLDGMPVLRIADYAFLNCTEIEHVTFSADIISIGNYAFAGCTSLEYILIPSSTESIGCYAFAGCTALDTLVLYNAGDIGDYAFAGCTALDSISIPSDTRRIGNYAFAYCTNLSSVGMWDSEEIGDYAFYGCTKLQSIYIPSDTKRIGAHAFEQCSRLSSLSISDAEVIAEYAFAGCIRLTSVYIPSGTKHVEAHAFDGCTRLRSVSISDDDTVIDAAAFSNCPNLRD